jgi:hypothetical protein
MSYWICDPAKQVFSTDQVTRMHYALDHCRARLIGRTVKRTACLWTWIPILGGRIGHREPGVLPQFQGWDGAALERYLERLEREGPLRAPTAATSEWLTRSVNEVSIPHRIS